MNLRFRASLRILFKIVQIAIIYIVVVGVHVHSRYKINRKAVDKSQNVRPVTNYHIKQFPLFSLFFLYFLSILQEVSAVYPVI